MTKTPEYVHNFLDATCCRLDNRLHADLETLAEAKRAMEGLLARRLRHTIFPSTQPGLVRERMHHLGPAKAVPYFSVGNIILGIASLVDCLSGVSVEEMLLERSEGWTKEAGGNIPVQKILFFDALTDKTLGLLYLPPLVQE